MRLIDADKFRRYIHEQLSLDDFCVPDEILEMIDEQPTVNEWIPCSERLPNDMEEVLVWFEYFRYGNYNKLFQTQGIGYAFNGEWSGFINGTSGWEKLRIVAWQPLPQPYKEETK